MASLVWAISDITPSVMMRSTKYCEPSWTAAAYLCPHTHTHNHIFTLTNILAETVMIQITQMNHNPNMKISSCWYFWLFVLTWRMNNERMSIPNEHLVFSAEPHAYIYLLWDVPVLLTQLFCLHQNPIMLFVMQNTLQKLWQEIWLQQHETNTLCLLNHLHVNFDNTYNHYHISYSVHEYRSLCLPQNTKQKSSATFCNYYFIPHNYDFVLALYLTIATVITAISQLWLSQSWLFLFLRLWLFLTISTLFHIIATLQLTIFTLLHIIVILYLTVVTFVIISISQLWLTVVIIFIVMNISHNFTFVSQNCNFIAHNWQFVAHNCDFISQL